MVCHIPVNIDIAKSIEKQYLLQLELATDLELIKEFLSYLDYTDESESGRVFHPVEIGCCRAMIGEALGHVLHEMRRRAV